jgi:hypothetical protein
MDLSQEELRELLRKNVDVARKRHDQAQRAFWKIAAEADGDLSRAERERLITDADVVYVASQENLLFTLKQFNDFLLQGVIPDGAPEDPAA